MIAMGAFVVPGTTLAKDTAVVQSYKQADAHKQTMLPLRSELEKLGVKVGWEQIVTPKILLTWQNQTFEIKVDNKAKVLVTNAGSFKFNSVNGSISVEPAFFTTIMNNVKLNASQDQLAKINAGQAIALRNLATYVKEAKPAPVKPASYVFETGIATWYGSALQGNYTASGEIFNMYDYTAAHKTLPFGTRVRVTNQNNGKSVIVRITDRGPFAPGRIIDLSMQAASDIDMISSGVAPVKLEVLY